MAEIEAVPEELEFENPIIDEAVTRIQIAARAVVHELAITIEHEIQRHVGRSWANMPGKKPRILDLPQVVLEKEGWLVLSAPSPKLTGHTQNFADLAVISDERFPALLDMIAEKFGVDPRSLPEWAAIEGIRQKDNQLKHRKGFIHPKDFQEEGNVIERFNGDVEYAEQAIDQVINFLRSLDQAILQKQTLKP
jgi:hypothetical protein